MSSPTTVEVDASKCLITVTHRIHFNNLSMDKDAYEKAVSKAKKDIEAKWANQDFQFDLCHVRFVFVWVDGPSADADVKSLLSGPGAAYQQSANPNKRQAGAWFPENWGNHVVAAHEVGHELGMEDQYESFDAAGDPVPTWIGTGASAQPNPAAVSTGPKPGYSNNGIGFTTAPGATVQPQDIKDIMAKLKIVCPCPVITFEPAHSKTAGTSTTAPRTGTGTGPGKEEQSGASNSEKKPEPPVIEKGHWPDTLEDDDFYQPVNSDYPGLYDVRVVCDDDDSDDEEGDDEESDNEDDEAGGLDEYDDDCEAVPLFFVPGIMGSSLTALNPARQIWPVAATGPDLAPLYPGANTRRAMGLYPAVYEPLINFITRPAKKNGLGRVLGQDFFIFPYDWTQSNRDSGEQFKAVIENKLDSVNHTLGKDWKSVDVICHSMGGLVTRMAKSLGAPVRKVVYLATPHWGAPAAYFVLHPDIDYDFGLSLFEYLVASVAWRLLGKNNGSVPVLDALHYLSVALQSVWELMPDDFYLAANPILSVTYAAAAAEKLGIPPTYLQNKWRFAGHEAEIGDAMDFKKSLGPSPPEPRMLITNDSIDTAAHVHYTLATMAYDLPIKRPYGDKTVPYLSACSGVGAYVVPGDHVKIPNEALAHMLIKHFIPTRV